MEKNKFFAIIIIFLLLLNLGTLSFLFIKSGNEKHHPHHGRQDPGEFLINELGLDEQQKVEFNKLKEEHHSQMKALQDSIKVQRELLPNIIDSGNDSLAVAVSNKIGSYQQRVEYATYAHFKKVKSICTQDQRSRFKNVIEDMLKMMAAPPKGKPGHLGPPPH